MQCDFMPLKNAAERPIQDEADLVYFLVEVRKVLEFMPSRFRILNLFCDWIVHTRLDRAGARNIIGTFDGFLGDSWSNPETALKMVNHAYPLTSLRAFRSDLLLLLSENQMDLSLIRCAERWERFLHLYVDQIARTPLVATPGTFANLDEIRVRKLMKSTVRQRPDERFILGIEWNFIHQRRVRQNIVNDVFLPIGLRTVLIAPPSAESKTLWKT